jgi:hypothetical protein
MQPQPGAEHMQAVCSVQEKHALHIAWHASCSGCAAVLREGGGCVHAPEQKYTQC